MLPHIVIELGRLGLPIVLVDALGHPVCPHLAPQRLLC